MLYRHRGRGIRSNMDSGRTIVNSAIVGLVGFLTALLAGSALAPVQDSTASTTGSTNLEAVISSTPYYLTLSSSGTTLNIGATPGGALVAAEDTVNVKTNNPYGYQLYLSTDSTEANSNRLYLGGDSTKTYFSPTSGSFLNPQKLANNSWGYAIAESDAAAVRAKMSQTATTNFNDSYSTSPSDDSVWAAVPVKGSEQLIKSTSGANEAGVDTNVYYAAKATTALNSGTYTGKVLYTVIAENGAATEVISVAPSTIDANTAGQSIVISTPLPANASLIGDDVTVTVSDQTCAVTDKSNDATTALVNITCTAPSLAAGTYDVVVNVPFYDKAYTLASGLTYQNTAEYMQDFTSAKCNALTKNTDSVTLTDKRDNNEYTVRKLADGNCWMTTNLMLGNTIKDSGSITIDSTDSQYSGTSFTITSSNVMYSGKTNNWGSNDYDVLHIYARDATEKDSTSGNVLGNLYNWYTATAKSGTQNGVTSGDAQYSICPSKWRLPSNGTTAPSYQTLFYVTTANGGLNMSGVSSPSTTFRDALYAAPYSFPLAGYWNSGSLYDVGSNGYYWSRTAYNANYAYYFYFYSNGYFNLQNYNDKYYGRSVRCVFSG